ncbi:MAG: hypothetical protein GY757_03380 [bacterium]|nr:hypothetical protein [bacterium]
MVPGYNGYYFFHGSYVTITLGCFLPLTVPPGRWMPVDKVDVVDRVDVVDMGSFKKE